MIVESPKYESHWVQVFAGNFGRGRVYSRPHRVPRLPLLPAAMFLSQASGRTVPMRSPIPFVGWNGRSKNPTCVAPATVHTLQAWYNPCAFVPAPLGTLSDTAQGRMRSQAPATGILTRQYGGSSRLRKASISLSVRRPSMPLTTLRSVIPAPVWSPLLRMVREPSPRRGQVPQALSAQPPLTSASCSLR